MRGQVKWLSCFLWGAFVYTPKKKQTRKKKTQNPGHGKFDFQSQIKRGFYLEGAVYQNVLVSGIKRRWWAAGLQGAVERSARQKPEILMTAITDGKIKKQLLGKMSQIKTKLNKIYKVAYGTSACPFISFLFLFKGFSSTSANQLGKRFDWGKQFFPTFCWQHFWKLLKSVKCSKEPLPLGQRYTLTLITCLGEKKNTANKAACDCMCECSMKTRAAQD